MEATFNRLVLKALLLDTITFIKFKNHLAPNWRNAKVSFCNAKGLKTNISSLNLICEIGETYSQNNLTDEFESILAKYGLSQLIVRQ